MSNAPDALFLGIDIGTTNIKTALFNLKAELVAEKTCPNPVVRPHGWDGIEPLSVFETVKKLIKSTLGNKGKQVAGLAFTSMAETVFPVGKDGPLLEGICWYEDCTMPQYESFCSRSTYEHTHCLTALYPSWIYSASKIMKVRDDFPKIYEQTQFFADVSGFMAGMFSGEAGFDATIACRTMLWDIQKEKWSAELVQAAQLDIEKLPPPKAPGEPWGEGLKAELAEELGLVPGIAISTGGQDHIAAAAAANLHDHSSALISIGTSAAFYTPASREIFKQSDYLCRPFLAGGRSVYNNGSYILTGMPAGGFCMDWFIHRVLEKNYQWLDSFHLSQTPALFYPNLRSMTKELPPGGFSHISDKDTSASLFQSIMEALAFECRYTLDQAFKAKGSSSGFREAVLLGGGALNKPFIEIISHVLKHPVKLHSYPQSAAALGAALASAVAGGYFTSWKEATHTVHFKETVTPRDKDFSDYLDNKYLSHLVNFRKIDNSASADN